MATPRIPSGFKPTAAGYSVGAPSGVNITEVGGGLPRLGMEWSRGRQAFAVTMTMPQDAFGTWSVFYHRVIAAGGVQFTMPLDSGLGLADHICVMVPGSYSAVPVSGARMWTVSFSVLAESQVYSVYEDAVVTSTPRIPDGLKPVAAGYSIGAAAGVNMTEVSGGLSRVAMEWDRGRQAFAVTMILAQDKFTAWSTFFHQVIAGGGIQFLMPIDSGLGLSDHLCIMVPGSYSVVPVSGARIWSVSFSVLAESQVYSQYSTEDAQDLLELWELYGEDLDDLLARLAQFATVDTLVLTP